VPEHVTRYVPSDNSEVGEGIEKDFNKLFDSHYVDEEHQQEQHYEHQ
jgi:hypothetical protein